jgi:hypothetical protein
LDCCPAALEDFLFQVGLRAGTTAKALLASAITPAFDDDNTARYLIDR